MTKLNVMRFDTMIRFVVLFLETTIEGRLTYYSQLTNRRPGYFAAKYLLVRDIFMRG